MRSLEHLNQQVERLVSANQDLFSRLYEGDLQQSVALCHPSTSFPPVGTSLLSPPISAEASNVGLLPKRLNGKAREYHKFGADFEENLESSRVYRRALKEGDQLSLISSATRATPWSLMSDTSLANISAISVIALPIFSTDVTSTSHFHDLYVKTENINVVNHYDLNVNFIYQLWNMMHPLGIFSQPNFDSHLRLRISKSSLGNIPTPHLEACSSIEDARSRGFDPTWSAQFLPSLHRAQFQVYNALAFPKFRNSPRTLGSHGVQSLERAIKQVIFSIGDILGEINSMTQGSLWRSEKDGRIHFQSHEKTEMRFLGEFFKIKEMAVGVQLYHERLQTITIDEEENERFHVELKDPNNDPTYLSLSSLPKQQAYKLIVDPENGKT